MSSPVVLVYGWYGRANVGDELMKQALQNLFNPSGIGLRFVDSIDAAALAGPGVAGVLFGGGSILYDRPDVSSEALAALASGHIDVFYLGVGGETEIHPDHEKLIDVAKVVAFRELDMPDLVYSLQPDASPLTHQPAGLLFVPNVEVLPAHSDPHWMHVAWEHFKDEVAQALDVCIDRGLQPAFMLMCASEQKEDLWPAAEIMGRMKRRAPALATYRVDNLEATRLMRHHRVVVTQRYHGIVLAEMSGVPYVSVNHHNKLKLARPHRGTSLSYYGIQKDALIDAVDTALASVIEPYVGPRELYDRYVNDVVEAVRKRVPT
jgi:hypothetical protein